MYMDVGTENCSCIFCVPAVPGGSMPRVQEHTRGDVQGCTLKDPSAENYSARSARRAGFFPDEIERQKYCPGPAPR